MSENTKHVTYEDAGVDTAEGGRAVDAIKQMVKETNRPEVIGAGYLGSAELGGGEEVFARIVSHPRLRDLPFILETPNELAGYAHEIQLLRGLQGD